MNSQRKAWVAFLIVFALGGVTGASLDGIYRVRAGATPVVACQSATRMPTLKR